MLCKKNIGRVLGKQIKKTNDFYGDTLVKPMLDKLKVGHVSLEQGDLVQFQGHDFCFYMILQFMTILVVCI